MVVSRHRKKRVDVSLVLLGVLILPPGELFFNVLRWLYESWFQSGSCVVVWRVSSLTCSKLPSRPAISYLLTHSSRALYLEIASYMCNVAGLSS